MFKSSDIETSNLHLKIGTAHLNNGNYPSAISELSKSIELNDKNFVAHNNLALAFLFKERLDLAEEHLRTALQISPLFSEARNNLSRVLIERSRYEEALVESKIVVEDLTYEHPEKSFLNLGMAYFYLQNYPLAKKSLKKSLELERDNCLALNFFGRTLYESSEYSEASEALDRAASHCLRLQFDEPQYYSALSYFQIGAIEKTQARLLDLVKLYPNGQYVEKSKNMLKTIKR